jgi:putative ABC transport system permease protein
MLSIKLAWQQTLNLWRAGALRVLVFALIVAVTAITAVGFFTARVDSALTQQGGLLLGGDVAMLSDHVIQSSYIQSAQSLNLQSVNTVEFASMVTFGDDNQLAQIKAVDTGFPLRGDLTIGQSTLDAGVLVKHGPKQGEVWIEPRLTNLLAVKVGDQVQVGMLDFVVSQILVREPSRGGDMFNFAPRLMMHTADLPATELIQTGSRVKYQLLVAGAPQAVKQFYETTAPLLGRGEKIQDVQSARPEIRSALEKARQFLGLSAMVSLILAMVAMVLSSMPYIKQSLETFALMRCFGAAKQLVLQVLAWQTAFIAVLSAIVGIALGYIAQLGLEQVAGHLFVDALPPIPLAPIGMALLVSLAMMFAVVLPHAWQIRHLTAMNILRRETIAPNASNQFKYLPAALVMVAAIFWQANSVKLAAATVAALIGLSAVMVLLAWVCINASVAIMDKAATSKTMNSIKMGVYGLKRRMGLSIMQMIGFSIGLTVLMLLALVRNDLINSWQASLPADAPNRFVINIQSDQIPAVEHFFKQHEIKGSQVLPMIRGRLMTKNGEDMQNKVWKTDRQQRLAQREFNLSMAQDLQSDNQLLEGEWWRENDHGKSYMSIEHDLAKNLGVKLNDQLVFDIAGAPIEFTVTSIRKVDWDTMRANFFAVTTPATLNAFSASYLSSFHLPKEKVLAMNQLVKDLPNLTVIDIAALLAQVRGIMQQMSTTIAFVYLFSLVAGIAVIYAALVATQEARVMEATLMRVFGSSKREVTVAYLTEFVVIGFVAALVAVVVANGLADYLSQYVLNISFQFNVGAVLVSLVLASIFIPLAAWFGLRGYLNVTPRQLLQSV